MRALAVVLAAFGLLAAGASAQTARPGGAIGGSPVADYGFSSANELLDTSS
jgi:hypothetical protein